MIFSETCGALAQAMSKAQAEFKPALKDVKNTFFGSKYAELASIIEATRPALMKHELAVFQGIATDLERQAVSVSTRIIHGPSGEWCHATLEVPGVGEGKDRSLKFTAQTIGSASTYARRYGLKAALNIGEEDDDGNSGGEHKRVEKPPVSEIIEKDNSQTPRVPKMDGDGTMHVRVVKIEERVDKKGNLFFYLNCGIALSSGKPWAFCRRQSLFDALRIAQGEDCLFIFDTKQVEFPTIIDIKLIGNKKFSDGKPIEQDDLEITDADIPF